MILKDFFPKPTIREFVRIFRIVDFSFDKSSQPPVKVYPPKIEHVLAFFPRDTEEVEFLDGKKIQKLQTVLTGQQDRVIRRQVGNDFLIFQIIFQPGALFRLTGIPAFELTNKYLDAELIFSSSLRLVNEQLYHARTYKDMLEVGHQFVASLSQKRQMKDHVIDNIAANLLTNQSAYTIDELADIACLSFKQLERKFKERLGIMPKLFSRINRFDQAFCMKNLYRQMDWLSIAINCGYYDYQHLARDYKDLTGMTPNALHKIEDVSPEQTLGLSAEWYATKRN